MQKLSNEETIPYPETLLDIHRITVIMSALVQTRHLEGDIAEVGVYKGGVAYYLSKLSHGKRVFLFDTFEGIPMSGEFDKHPIGDFSDTDYEEVKQYFTDNPKATLVKGIFPASSIGTIQDYDKFSFVHLDADQYQSTLDSLNFFYDKMVVGGVIILDDYHYLKGVDKAIEEFLKDKPEKEIQSANMQCFIVKQ